MFHLDNVGTEVSKDLADPGASEDSRELDDSQPGERSVESGGTFHYGVKLQSRPRGANLSEHAAGSRDNPCLYEDIACDVTIMIS